jgi:beta-glucosidase
MYLIFIAVGIVIVLIAGIAIYGSLRIHSPSRKLPVQGQEFPDGFLWGTGEDAYQHEGGNLNNDWARWESQKPSPIENGYVCGRSVDFYNRYESDFELAKRDGQNSHRIGIEWSRVEPHLGVYDEDAWKHYEAMLVSLKAKGFTVFFNIWHFTLPLWATDIGGWESDIVMKRWEAFVRECAIRFGKYID